MVVVSFQVLQHLPSYCSCGFQRSTQGAAGSSLGRQTGEPQVKHNAGLKVCLRFSGGDHLPHVGCQMAKKNAADYYRKSLNRQYHGIMQNTALHVLMSLGCAFLTSLQGEFVVRKSSVFMALQCLSVPRPVSAPSISSQLTVIKPLEIFQTFFFFFFNFHC